MNELCLFFIYLLLAKFFFLVVSNVFQWSVTLCERTQLSSFEVDLKLDPVYIPDLVLNIRLPFPHSQFLAAGFFSGLHCFFLEHSIFFMWRFGSGQCLTGFMFCIDVYLKTFTPTLCVDCNFLSPFCIFYTMLVKLIRVVDRILLMYFLISLLGIFFPFQKKVNI